MSSQQTKEAVECAVTELVNLKRAFTGEDVFKRISNTRIRRKQDISNCTATAGEVSIETRKMFNSQNKAFSGYGSTIVPYPNGPVLYFALPYHAKLHVRKIVQSMAQLVGSSAHRYSTALDLTFNFLIMNKGEIYE